jgi:hypothetical protein
MRMMRKTVGRPLVLSALLGVAVGFGVLFVGFDDPSRAEAAQRKAARIYEYEVIAEIYGLELLAPPGARRPSDDPDQPPYVWRGVPLAVRVERSLLGLDQPFLVALIDDTGRTLHLEPLPEHATSALIGPLDTGELRAGGYRVTLTPANPVPGDRPTPQPFLEFRLGLPPESGGSSVPAFPWPPPRPATRHALGGDRLGSPETLGAAAERLLAALDASGYAEHSFFSVQPDPAVAPEGFALVTRLEQIDPDGSPRPGAERWSVALPEREIFSLGDFVRALFSAPEGHYRVIVFTVTGRPVAPSDDAPSRDDAGRWLGTGLARLPPALAELPWTRDHAVTALIYQFRQVGSGTEPQVNPPDAPPARDQLQRTGILAGLGGGR